SATQAQNNDEAGNFGHYIRSSAPAYPESFATLRSHRLTYSRANAYPAPYSALNVVQGLNSFDTRPCPSPPALTAQLRPHATQPATPFSANRATFDTPQQLLDEIKQFPFRDQNSSQSLPTPPCAQQPPQPSIGQVSESTGYTHVYANP